MAAADESARSTRYREIEAVGTPRAMGRQIGEAARDEIRGFCEVALERVNVTTRVSRATALAVARDSLPYAERYLPDAVEELRGTAEAAGVSLDDLMLLQVRNQLQPELDAGCTSLSVCGTPETGRIVAQNWDNDPALDAFTVVLTRRPVGKPALMSVTQAGLIAYIGFNSAGIGLCLNSLPAPSRRVGVPHYFTVRGIYEADSLEQAIGAVRAAERAIPANIMLSTPQGPADLEVTIDDVRVLRADAAGRLAHANHALHPDLAPLLTEYPELIQSSARQQRIEALLETAHDSSRTLAAIQASLRDHTGYPRSICRHVNDDPSVGFWKTVISVLIEPESGRMHVARGNPCERPYETYQLR